MPRKAPPRWLIPRIVCWALVALTIAIIYQNFLSNALFVVFSIVSDQNGLFYVAHSLTGTVTVHRLQHGQLIQIESILLGYSIDNILLDADSNLIEAAIPDLLGFVKASEDLYNAVAPTNVLSLDGFVCYMRSHRNDYRITKVVEDNGGKVLPGILTALHDVQSQRLFLGGVFSSFVGIRGKIAT